MRETPVLFSREGREETISSQVSNLRQTTLGRILRKSFLITHLIEKLSRADMDTSGFAGSNSNFEYGPWELSATCRYNCNPPHTILFCHASVEVRTQHIQCMANYWPTWWLRYLCYRFVQCCHVESCNDAVEDTLEGVLTPFYML
jgi:hypothetical protein